MSIKIRSRHGLNLIFPDFIHFADSSDLVTDKLTSLKPPPDDWESCLKWHMWLPHVNPTVVKTVQAAGYSLVRISSRDYREVRGGIWDYSDTEQEREDFSSLSGLVKINRFPGSFAICDKDKLVINYKWLQQRSGCFDFLPESYALPSERKDLLQALKNEKNSLWIVKPSNQSCGNGINVIKRAYLYDDGLVRFASEQYNDNDSDLDNNLIHLTNFFVNRGNKESVREDRDGMEGSVKWTVGALREYMERRGEDWRNIWREIEDLCVKTLLCGHYSMLTEYESSSVSEYHCYKLLGFDVMLDRKMKPWLLEVNSFPSMFPNQTDLKVNGPLVAEMFNILGFHSALKKDILEEFYSRAKNKEQERKENTFYNNINQEMDLMLNITKKDFRTILKLEEELSQTRHFKPLLPDHERKSLIEVLDIQSYNDHLLMQFDERKKQGYSLENLKEIFINTFCD